MWPHQQEALLAIRDQSGIVHHACGTGKSRIIQELQKNLTVIVVPSLALQSQFLQLLQRQFLLVSSAHDTTNPGTTEQSQVEQFLLLKGPKTVLVTYQSLGVVIAALQETKQDPDNFLFDEAHHVTKKSVHRLLWQDGVWQLRGQRLFFTATLRNKNGIVMDPDLDQRNYDFYEQNNLLPAEAAVPDKLHGDCGPVLSRFTHQQAVEAGVCNDFLICCELGSSRETISHEQLILESILQSLKAHQMTRALTFHRAVQKGVCLFTPDLLRAAAERVLDNSWAAPRIITLSAETPNRAEILAEFDAYPDYQAGFQNQIVILASCRTIGEGIDTKRAQLVAFADPKKAKIDILQNIGRVCRKADKPAVVLIPCIVNREKYEAVSDDPEQRDLRVREDLAKGGDFSAILNVASALKQSDPKTFNLCWAYPDSFSPEEVKDNLQQQGCRIWPNYEEMEQEVTFLFYFIILLPFTIGRSSSCARGFRRRFWHGFRGHGSGRGGIRLGFRGHRGPGRDGKPTRVTESVSRN
jgi:superfamily II DNA or RNA helicase